MTTCEICRASIDGQNVVYAPALYTDCTCPLMPYGLSHMNWACLTCLCSIQYLQGTWRFLREKDHA